MLSLDMILNSHGIGKQNSLNSELTKHLSDKNNPHNITKEQIGLGNVDNVKQASKTEFDAHLADVVKHITSAERTSWNGKLDASIYTASDILTKLKTVDGPGSGLDADTLDGLHASAFSTAKMVAGTYTGNDSSNRLISVGFQPKMVIVYGDGGGGPVEFISLGSDCLRHYSLSHNIQTDALKLSNNGFTVNGSDVNFSGRVYKYFAIG